MGGGAQSKHQTHVFTNEKQLWCSGCKGPFDQPVKLGCGHKVCGPNSKNKCAKKVLENKICPVANCGFKLPENPGRKDLKSVDTTEVSEYDVAFQLDMDDRGPDESAPSTARGTVLTILNGKRKLAPFFSQSNNSIFDSILLHLVIKFRKFLHH